MGFYIVALLSSSIAIHGAQNFHDTTTTTTITTPARGFNFLVGPTRSTDVYFTSGDGFMVCSTHDL